MLLEEEVDYAMRGPVWAKAGASMLVQDLHALMDGANDGFLDNWEDHENLHWGLRKGLNGSIMSRSWA